MPERIVEGNFILLFHQYGIMEALCCNATSFQQGRCPIETTATRPSFQLLNISVMTFLLVSGFLKINAL